MRTRAPIDPDAAWERIRASGRRRLLLPSLLAMTFATGIIDAVSFLGIGGVFTANMTGNAIILGFGLAGGYDFSFSRAFVALAVFATGAAIAGRLARTWHEVPFIWFRRVTLLEIGLLVVTGALLIGLVPGTDPPDELRRYLAIATLSLAMGMRNATVRRLGFTDVPTTVVTSTITDVASDSWFGGGERRREHVRLAAITAMVLGAAVGAGLMRVSMLVALGAALLVVLLVALHHVWISVTVPRSVAAGVEPSAVPGRDGVVSIDHPPDDLGDDPRQADVASPH